MNKLILPTAIAVVVLAIVLILDHTRVTAQLREVRDRLGELENRFDGMLREDDLRDVRSRLDGIQGALSNIGPGEDLSRIAERIEALHRRLDTGIAVQAGGDDGAGDSGSADDGSGPADDGSEDGYEPDGLPRLGANFLLPYHSPFDPTRLGGTLNSYGSTPKGLNSIIENATTNSAIDGLVNDGLCTRDSVDPKRWRSVLATSCVISDDYKVYTFTIRPGVHWHVPPLAARGGYAWLDQRVELTAEDFVFYVRMIQDPQVEAPHLRNYYEKLEKAEALDRYTLQLTWSEKLYTNLSSSFGLSPLPRHIYTVNEDGQSYPDEDVGVHFNRHWFDLAQQHIGVGPYRLVSFQPDEQMVFVRNPAYWGETKHFTKLVWLLRVKDPFAQLTGFKNGSVQTYNLRPDQYLTEIVKGGEPRFAPPDPERPHPGRRGELGWERCKSLSYSYIGWNMRRPLFADRRVRQAMSHAFPRQRLLKDVYHGLGSPLDTNVHPDSDYANTGLPAYRFDLAEASRLLATAGWSDNDGDGWLDKVIDGERRDFRFEAKIYADSKEWSRIMDIYSRTLAGIGIKMTVKPLEWKDLLHVYENKDFDAVSGGWRMAYEVDFKQVWHSSAADEPRGSNHCGFKNPRADELAEQLRRTFDFEERKRIAFEFQKIIHAAQPYTFFRASEFAFCWQNKPGPRRPALGGVTGALDELHPFYNRDSDYWYFRE